MPKTTKCACGYGKEFIPSHGRKYATKECKYKAAKKKLKPERSCIHCKKLIPQKQTLRRPVCLGPDCMTWWNEVEAPRRQAERNRVWARKKRKAGGQKKPRSGTHKVKVTTLDPNAWTHEKYLAEQEKLSKPNGRICIGCNKVELVGDEKFRCQTCLHRTDDYMSECGDSGSMTRVFRTAAG